MATKQKIMRILRENPKTIAELAEDLGLARNAITVQMDRLLSEGLVHKGTLRRPKSAGKPAQEYVATPGTEDAGSAAYGPFLTSLVSLLATELKTPQRKRLLESVGRDMALQAGLQGTDNIENDVLAAIEIVNGLGATAEWSEDIDNVVVRNVSCPLASAVRIEACVCDAVAAFFSEATGRPATAACVRGEKLECRYVIEKSESKIK